MPKLCRSGDGLTSSKNTGTGTCFTIARNTKEKQVFPWLFARLFVPLQRTTKKVVTKKIVIWRIPLSSEQL